jgi:uncharacterized protein (DUF2384 family)
MSTFLKLRPALVNKAVRALAPATGRISADDRQANVSRAPAPALSGLNFVAIYKSDALSRIALARAGIRVGEAKVLLSVLGISDDSARRSLKLSRKMFQKKSSRQARLSVEESEKIIGLAALLGKVEVFAHVSRLDDAAVWLFEWLNCALDSLGSRRPLEFLDTVEGLRLLSTLVDDSLIGPAGFWDAREGFTKACPPTDE